MADQQFGGPWTEDKLTRLGKYLPAYTKIFENQSWAQTYYIDGFAGTGSIQQAPTNAEEAAVQQFLDGSVRVALRTKPPFHNYVFIEKDVKKAAQLQAVRSEFPSLANQIEVVNDDANAYLVTWCGQMASHMRAVLFLDPFGIQVKWTTLKAVADTKKIDLWMLVPLGIGANRLMTRDGTPDPKWSAKLDEMFGTHDWVDVAYKEDPQRDLFSDEPRKVKQVSYQQIERFFIERLATIFKHVPDNPLTQKNSRNTPLFSLYFAAHNETAAKIAKHILGRKHGHKLTD